MSSLPKKSSPTVPGVLKNWFGTLGHSTEMVCMSSGDCELEGIGSQVNPGSASPSMPAGRYTTGVMSPGSAGHKCKLQDLEELRTRVPAHHCSSKWPEFQSS